MLASESVDELCFGHGLPVNIRLLLQKATRSYEDTAVAESLLIRARKLAPQALEVGITLYKFYFYKYRLADAEMIARETLDRAAQLGNFDTDWQQLDVSTAPWHEPLGPERAYLFTLKALAFISLRLERTDEAMAMLDKLQELDPSDQLGATVVRDLAVRLEDTDEWLA